MHTFNNDKPKSLNIVTTWSLVPHYFIGWTKYTSKSNLLWTKIYKRLFYENTKKAHGVDLTLYPRCFSVQLTFKEHAKHKM